MNENVYPSSEEVHKNFHCSQIQSLNIEHYHSLIKLPIIESDIKAFGNVLESYYFLPKLVLSKTNTIYKFTPFYLTKQIFRRTHEENKDSLSILPEDMIKIILEYLIPTIDTMILKPIILFHYLRLDFQSPKFK